MDNDAQYESGPLPPNCELIEVHVAELQQLFNAIDPSPFREKDLSANGRNVAPIGDIPL